jgi:TRAP-type transport system periplasmic protein
MNRLHRGAIAAALAACALLAQLSADIVLKTGTIAPDGSIWAKGLREMGEAWKRRTSGRVMMQLFPGTVGSEEEIVRRLRVVRSLQVGQLSAIELARLDESFNLFGLPMFFESYEEVDRILESVGPALEQRLEKKGFKLLHWGHAGWVHMFSKTPVQTPAQLKKLKLFTAAGDTRWAAWYQQNGFNPRPTDASQMLASLTTNMLEAVPMTPLSAQMFQWYDHAPYMMDIGFAPLLGATLIRLDTWNTIATGDQAIVLEEARQAGRKLRLEVPKLDAEAVTEMKKKKLIVTTGNAAEWRTLADQFGASMRETLVPADVYDHARRERDAFRARGKASR